MVFDAIIEYIRRIKDIKKNTKMVHSISKPVRKPDTNEWVVKWMTNGRRDENKTYYTDDKQDAFDTYEQMVKNANDMNKYGK